MQRQHRNQTRAKREISTFELLSQRLVIGNSAFTRPYEDFDNPARNATNETTTPDWILGGVQPDFGYALEICLPLPHHLVGVLIELSHIYRS